MDENLKHLREENVRLKKTIAGMRELMKELVEEYGDRPRYGEGLFTRGFQKDHRIQRAMVFIEGDTGGINENTD